MLTFRAASLDDLPAIHRLQDIPFRDQIFANRLPDLETFLKETAARIIHGQELDYILEDGGIPIGFTQYLISEEHRDLIYWGKWINTLACASFKVAFEDLGFPKLRGAVRENNRRVIRLHRELGIRQIGRESLLYRKSLLDGIAVAHFIYFEITAQEFGEKKPLLQSLSREVRFLT